MPGLWRSARAFSNCSEQGLLTGCGVRVSRCGSCSRVGAQPPGRRGFSSCGPGASLLHGMWALPGPGIESVSPALGGGFFTTEPPGKPKRVSFLKKNKQQLYLYWDIAD